VVLGNEDILTSGKTGLFLLNGNRPAHMIGFMKRGQGCTRVCGPRKTGQESVIAKPAPEHFAGQ
jgi:hypothetical protein